MAKNLFIEISIAQNEEDDFDHWGYYDSIEEAINELFNMKENIDDFYED